MGRWRSSVTPDMRPRLQWVAANVVQVDEAARTFLLHPYTREPVFKGQSNKPNRVRTLNGNIYRAARCVRSCGLLSRLNRVQLVTVARCDLHAFAVLVAESLETGHEIGVHPILSRMLAPEFFGFEVGV